MLPQYEPYVVKYIEEPETHDIIKENQPESKGRVIKEESSELVRYALESVVSSGTGKNAYIENYRIGGKTGTAQKVKDGRYMSGNYIVSFIGVLPVDKPEYIVYIAIDYPKGFTQYGGTVSAPIAKSVMKSIIDIKNIPPSKEVTPREYTWLDQKYIKLPNVIGQNIKEAKKTLKGFKIEYSGTGEKIIYQEPEPDIFVKENSTIKVLLG